MKPDLLLLLLGFGSAWALAACSSSPTITVPKEVRVPTPVACVDLDKRPRPPALRGEAELLALDRYQRTLAAWSDLRKHEIYQAELEAIVEACSRIPR